MKTGYKILLTILFSILVFAVIFLVFVIINQEQELQRDQDQFDYTVNEFRNCLFVNTKMTTNLTDAEVWFRLNQSDVKQQIIDKFSE